MRLETRQDNIKIIYKKSVKMDLKSLFKKTKGVRQCNEIQNV